MKINRTTDNRITALYCRLSQDDGNEGESMSIASQKAILINKAEELGITNYEIYVDDGWSGTNFERPSFQKMISDIVAGKIGCVITKDLSRLGRNYIESGTYIEMVFPQHNVRYIAVNDGVDSYSTSGMEITPFKNILNEMYSRDISKKVKTAKAIRASQGKFMGTWAPFGYIKDPADKNHLIIDENTAPTVKYIFDLALKGYGTSKIGKVLYAEKIMKPAYYKQEHFGQFLVNPDDAYDWKMETITRILRNPLYKGYFWVNTYSKDNLKQKSRGYIPIADRKIIKSNHDAIVSEEVWDSVQSILDRHSKIKPCTSGYNNVFRGLLKCDCCGASLLVHTDTRFPDKPVEKKTYFQCRTYRTRGTSFCSQHRINAPELEEAVLSDIQSLAQSVIEDREEFITTIMDNLGSDNARKQMQVREEIKALKKQNEEADDKYIKLYDDMSAGLISDSKFKLLSSRIEEEQKQNETTIEELEKKLYTSSNDTNRVEFIADELAECTKIKELSNELLNRIIDRIEISEPVVTDNGERFQNVRIFYKFIGAVG